MLAGIEPHLPARPHTDLDPGIAALTQRLTDHRLTVTTDPAAQAELHTTLSRRYANAGLHNQAVTAAEQAVAIRRALAETDPAQLPGLTAALDILGRALADSGSISRGLSLIEEAVAIRRRLAETDPAVYLPDLATSLNNHGSFLFHLGRHEEAVPFAEEAVAVRRGIADTNPASYQPKLANSLHNLGVNEWKAGRAAQAAAPIEEAVAIWRKLAEASQSTNLTRVHRLAERLKAGGVYVNGARQNLPHTPFGGLGVSGYGKEGGRAGIDEFLRYKTVSITEPQ